MTVDLNTQQHRQNATSAAATANATSVQPVTYNVLKRPSRSAKTVPGLTSPYAMTQLHAVTLDAHVPKALRAATTKEMFSNVRKPPFPERVTKNIPRGSSNLLVATLLCAKMRMALHHALAVTIPNDAPPMDSASKSATTALGSPTQTALLTTESATKATKTQNASAMSAIIIVPRSSPKSQAPCGIIVGIMPSGIRPIIAANLGYVIRNWEASALTHSAATSTSKRFQPPHWHCSASTPMTLAPNAMVPIS